jgi:hypothetical protein
MPEQPDDKITQLNPQHYLFISEAPKLKFKLRIWCRAQVEAGQIWQVYRDGVYYDQLKAGPHSLWNNLWHRWKVYPINIRTVQLKFTSEGRLRGPSMPGDSQSVTGIDLGCAVKAELQLSCKISNIETFLEHEDPLTTFSASLDNMVIEIIGKLPYDQFGDWATTLRDAIRERLQGGRNDAERLIGMRVEEVYVTKFDLQDRQMSAMYQQVARVRRELTEAQANHQRDGVVAQSFAEQGNILNIAPSILALQDSPIGKELIARDADLRKMMVAAGLNPGVSVQPLRDPQMQINAGSPQPAGYLNAPQQPAPQFPSGTTGPISGSMAFNPNPNFQGSTGSMAFNSIAQSTTGNWNGPLAQPAPPVTVSGSLVDTERQDQEITALQTAGFQCAGRGQHSPLFDGSGQPIPGSMEWVLEVYVQRINGFITIVFHCPSGYPHATPRVQVRTPGTGSSLKAIIPNVVKNWNAQSMLVEIVREIDDTTP